MLSILNKYVFSGCSVELKSEEPLFFEKTFSLFKSDFENADYYINIKRVTALPEKTGECIALSERRKIYVDGEKRVYTAYYDVHKRDYVDYACCVNNGTLYISYPGELRELMVFDGLDLPSLLLCKNIGIMHCSFIDYNGEAILFAGNKQVGKSTQATLWEKYSGAEVINGDRAALTIENGRIYACGIPFCGTSKICKNKKLPLRTIVFPDKNSENIIRRFSFTEAFARVLGTFTYNQHDKNSVENIMTLTTRIIERIPIYEFQCLKDKSCVDYLKSAIDE